MNETLINKLLNLKISLVRKVVRGLPESVQKPVLGMETLMMRALYDISKQFLEIKPNEENTKQSGRVKVIDVE